MALLKEKSLPNGISGNYWKITEIFVNRMQRKARCVIALFKDEGHKSTAPIGAQFALEFSLSDQELSDDITEALYLKIKSYANSDLPNLDGNGTHKGIPDLVDATDV